MNFLNLSHKFKILFDFQYRLFYVHLFIIDIENKRKQDHKNNFLKMRKDY